jgi:hypothetical protein
VIFSRGILQILETPNDEIKLAVTAIGFPLIDTLGLLTRRCSNNEDGCPGPPYQRVRSCLRLGRCCRRLVSADFNTALVDVCSEGVAVLETILRGYFDIDVLGFLALDLDEFSV